MRQWRIALHFWATPSSGWWVILASLVSGLRTKLLAHRLRGGTQAQGGRCSLSGGRTTACGLHALGGAHCGEQGGQTSVQSSLAASYFVAPTFSPIEAVLLFTLPTLHDSRTHINLETFFELAMEKITLKWFVS